MNGRLLHLEGDALVEDLADTAIGGVDGLAFLDGVLYVNNVQTGDLYRIEMADGAVSGYTTLTLDRALEGPDGMRTAADGSGLYVAENAAGRVSKITIDGDSGSVETVGQGNWISATAIAEVGGQLYVIDTQFPSMGAEGAADIPFNAMAVAGGM
ncbi:MAG: hypothetical protein KIS96_09345 [Bauldia sp.]|nr:hypothetical protein [Bauldia sp.]